MADIKISQLEELLAPYPTDVLPIVSQGNNKKVSVSTLIGQGYNGTDLKELTGKYEDVSTTVLQNSAEWERAYDISTAYSLASSTFLTSESDNQTLFYAESSQELSIRDGNTVSLSALNYQGTDLKALTARYESTSTVVEGNSSSWINAYDIATAYSVASSTFITFESDNQTLTFNQQTQDLTITNGNTVSLGSLASKNFTHENFVPLSGEAIIRGSIALQISGDIIPSLYVESSSVGINTSAPNVELTVIGDISATGKLYGDGQFLENTDDESVNTVVRNTSGFWDTSYIISTAYQEASSTFATNNFVNSNFLNLTGGTITGDVTLLQNLFVNGTAVYINASDLVVSDPIIYIGEDNPADTLDLGFMVSWTEGLSTYTHGGFVRRADNKVWTLFRGASAEPLSSTNVEWDQIGLGVDTLSANFAGNLVTDTLVFGSLSASGTIEGANLSVLGLVSGSNLRIDDWNNAYDATTTYRSVSGSYATINFVDDKFLPLSGGNITGTLGVQGSLLSGGFDLHDLFLTSETDSQTLSFDEVTFDLGISNGNTLSLSSINTTFASNSSKYEEVYSNVVMNSSAYLSAVDLNFLSVSGNWNEAYNISTAYSLVSSTFLTSETDSQTLSFDEVTFDLGISNGNTLNLSSINTTFASNSSKYEEVYSNVVTNSSAYLSSVDLSFLSVSGNWNEAYNISTSYQNTSASYATVNFVNGNFLPLSGNTIITGTFEISGGSGISTLFVNSSSVGINVENPNKELTVVGDVSATGTIEGSNLNVDEWNIAYDIATAYSVVSSTFLTSETDSQTLSFNENNKELTISNGNTISLSALMDDTGIDTGVRSLTSNWESTYTTVANKSGTEWDNNLVTQYINSNFLHLSGGTMTGKLTVSADASSSRLNIGNAITNPGPATIVDGDVWISNQNKLAWRSNGNTINAAGLSQTNTFNQPQTIGSTSNASSVLIVTNTGTREAATFTAQGNVPAVRITQTGTGNAFVVEDSTNPDATPFVVDAVGSVGVGLSSLSGVDSKLTVVGNISSSALIYASSGNSDEWSSAFSTVQSNSSTNWNNSLVQQYVQSNFLPLSGGSIYGPVSSNSTFVLETSSDSDCFKITQTGSGNAFVVEDESNPDSTPFVITNIGRVGIGTTTPVSKFSLVHDDVNAFRIYNNDSLEYYASFGVTLSAGYFTAGSGLVRDVPLIFRTSFQGAEEEKVRFTADGKVGINTPNPNHTLTVIGSMSSTDTVYAKQLELSSVTFTNEILTNATSITANNDFLKVVVGGNVKYLRLYDVE